MKFGLALRVLVLVTLVLGVFTVFTINHFGVPSVLVYSAIMILIAYSIALVRFSMKEARMPVYVFAGLSLLTMAATFSSTEHLQLIESGYLPAIFIIFGGFATQAVLFVVSILSLRKKIPTTSDQVVAQGPNEINPEDKQND